MATRRFIDVLGWSSLGLLMQASGGWADVPATTRPRQRVQPEAAGDRVATDSDRQSGRAGYRLRGWTAGPRPGSSQAPIRVFAVYGSRAYPLKVPKAG